MFNEIFVEEKIKDHPITRSVLTKLKQDFTLIDSYDDYWGRVKKPYLQKRSKLNLFIARKEGQLLKETPDAYGTSEGVHYYFIHAYNCIYECQYCYLQGHFNTPDLVFFVNHDEILKEMATICDKEPKQTFWFHAGEYSDSLALSHITGELPLYWEFFKNTANARLEIRTKSVNIKPILALPPNPNIIISFSLSSHEMGKALDNKCPSIKARLAAIKKLADHGYLLGIHFDPIVYEDDFEVKYKKVIGDLFEHVPAEQIQYISLGVVRFTKSDYQAVKNNYPTGQIFAQDFVKSFDDKIRYNRPMRRWILSTVKKHLLKFIDEDKIYLCMED